MNLDKLEAVAREATPGPWEALSDTPTNPRKRISVTAPCEPVEDCGYHSVCIALVNDWSGSAATVNANAAHIAAFNPQVAIKLIAAVRAAKYVAFSNGFDAAYDEKFVALRSALLELGEQP